MSSSTRPPLTSTAVSVISSLTVPLMLPVLDSIDDAALRREISEEAVRMSVVERLGGFDGVTVHEGEFRDKAPSSAIRDTRSSSNNGGAPPSTFHCRVDFDALSLCIRNLQEEYARMVGVAETLKAELDQALETGRAAAVEENASTDPQGAEPRSHAIQLKRMRELVASMLTTPQEMPVPCGTSQRPDGDDGQKEHTRRLLGSDDDGSEGGSDEEFRSDPVAAGYARLSDD